ncbi:MAG: hypothetical protein WKG03_08850 [Telluria sp.]
MSKAYANFNMGTAFSEARNLKIVDFMQAARKANTDEIAVGTGIDKRAVCRHLSHLCKTSNIEQLTPKCVKKGSAAIYGYVQGEYSSPVAVMYPFAAQGA